MSESATSIGLKSLQERLHVQIEVLQAAEATIHALRLAQLAKDHQIGELKARIFALEAAAIEARDSNGAPRFQTEQDTDLSRVKAELAARAQELEMHDQLVAAAEQERATHLAYIEHLEGRLAQLQQRP